MLYIKIKAVHGIHFPQDIRKQKVILYILYFKKLFLLPKSFSEDNLLMVNYSGTIKKNSFCPI